MERHSNKTFIFFHGGTHGALKIGILKIFAMLSFLKCAVNFFANVVKVEKIAIFKLKFYEIKVSQNEKAFQIIFFCY